MSTLQFLALAGALTAIVPAAGCCSMARLFCGPDRTPWVSVGYDTARDTLATFLEAIRRDRPDVAVDCLAESYKKEHDISQMGFNVFWERLRAENPYLHYVGYSTIPDTPIRQESGGVRYDLLVDGQPLQIDLVRQSYWEVKYSMPDGSSSVPGRFLDHAALTALMQIARLPDGPDDEPQSSIDLDALRFVHPGRQPLTHDDVERVAVGRAWKIANLTLPVQ